MAEPSLTRQGPLAGATLPVCDIDPCGVRLGEVPFLTQIGLRGDGRDGRVTDGIAEATGLATPMTIGEVTQRGALQILCLAPDEWLLLDSPGQEATHLTALLESLSDLHATAIALSDNGTFIRLTGDSAATVLAKSCALDLHANALPPGSAARTLFDQVEVTLIHTLPPPDAPLPNYLISPTYLIGMRRSFADHIWHRLADNALEFGVGPL